MRNRIASIVLIVTGLPLLAACATTASDSMLLEGGTVDAQSMTARLHCPRGTELIHGQTMGVETAMWCEKPGNVKHGPFIDWYENHQKKTAGEYIDGQRQGPWSFFAPTGQLDTRITYDKGAAISTETGPAGSAPPPVAPAPPVPSMAPPAAPPPPVSPMTPGASAAPTAEANRPRQ